MTHPCHVRETTDASCLDTRQARTIARATGHLTQRAPKAGLVVANAEFVNSVVLALVAAFRIATDTSPTRIAHTDTAVGGRLCATHTWLVTAVTHPVTLAIDTADHVVVLTVAGTPLVAVRFARAVGHMTGYARPAGVARTCVVGRIARAMTCTIHAIIPRTSWNLTQASAPAREEEALAHSAHNAAVTAAFSVAAVTSPARIADTRVRVGRRNGTVDTGVVAGAAHPADLAVDAARHVVCLSITGATVHAVRFARAVRCSTVLASPARETDTLVRVSIARTIAAALFASR